MSIDTSQIYVHLLTLNLNFNTRVDTELHCMQLFFRYIRLVTTRRFHNRPYAVVYCYVVRSVLHIVESCSGVFDNRVRMRSITAVLGSHESRLHI